MKHDTSMDYLAEILTRYKSPRIRKKAVHLLEILSKQSYVSADRKQIDKILYEISQFKKTSYYIWNGYAEEDDKYQFYLKAENELIDSINRLLVSTESLYYLIKKLEMSENSDFMLKILFNIGNRNAFDLLKASSSGVETIVEDADGDIDIYGMKFKKLQKTG